MASGDLIHSRIEIPFRYGKGGKQRRSPFRFRLAGTKPARVGCTGPHTQRRLVMPINTKDIHNMEDLFVHQLQSIYYAEKEIHKVMPKMAAKMTDASLRAAVEGHLKETDGQIKRLEQVFKHLGKPPQAVNCPTVDGLIKAAGDVLNNLTDKHLLDAAMIAADHAVEHYEITCYGTLIAWARQLGRQPVVDLLEETIKEEKAMDKKLTTMAESKINRLAA
jgi:ferritin-like metal-binding protein YciE